MLCMIAVIPALAAPIARERWARRKTQEQAVGRVLPRRSAGCTSFSRLRLLLRPVLNGVAEASYISFGASPSRPVRCSGDCDDATKTRPRARESGGPRLR